MWERFDRMLTAYEKMARAVERQSVATANWLEYCLLERRKEINAMGDLRMSLVELRQQVNALQKERTLQSGGESK
jgi:hypothetical protein